MRIQVKYLTDILLRQFDISYPRSDNPPLNFDQVFLISGHDQFASNILYIGAISQLPSVPPTVEDSLLLLCVQDVPPPVEYLEKKNVILLLCDSSTSLQDLFNCTSQVLFSAVLSIDRLRTFLGEIATASTFTKLMSTVSGILNCSCAVLSSGFKLLGYSEHPNVVPSRSWRSMLRRRYYPNIDIISQLNTARNLTIFDPETRRIVVDPVNTPECGDAFFPLLSEDSSHEVLGFLYFCYNRKDQFISDSSVIHLIAYALSFRMWRYINMPSNSNSSLCFLLRDIASGSLIDDEEIANRLTNIRFTPSEHSFLIVIRSSGMDRSSKHSWAHLKMAFGQLYPNDVLFTYNGDIAILISSLDSNTLPVEDVEALSILLREHGCYAGISDCFDRIDRSFRNHYIRTVTAAKIAQRYNMGSHYTLYTDVALLHLVQDSSFSGNMRDFCDPRILRLAAYDRKHSSNYIHTLQCYWHFNQDVQNTCNYLFIHRNTLFYRLKKIKEIVNLDFNNSKHFLQFDLSFAILTALGDIPYSDIPITLPTPKTDPGL